MCALAEPPLQNLPPVSQALYSGAATTPEQQGRPGPVQEIPRCASLIGPIPYLRAHLVFQWDTAALPVNAPVECNWLHHTWQI